MTDGLKKAVSYQNRKPKKSILERREAVTSSPRERVKVGRWCKGRWIETIEYRT